jgi:hypothetical protein
LHKWLQWQVSPGCSLEVASITVLKKVMRRNEIPRKRLLSRLPTALLMPCAIDLFTNRGLKSSYQWGFLWFSHPACVLPAPPLQGSGRERAQLNPKMGEGIEAVRKKRCLVMNRRGLEKKKNNPTIVRGSFVWFDARYRCSQQFNAGSGRLLQQPENGFWSSGRGRGRIGDILEAQVSF